MSTKTLQPPSESAFASGYQPVLEIWRGPIIESVHFGAIAVVDSEGVLSHAYGNPYLVTYLRSAAKPFQALPFVELGGLESFGLTEKELAIMCASHDGTDEHLAVLTSLQKKIGVSEQDLQCGVHAPYHGPTEKALWLHGEQPTPNRHNCSGKHTGMLALARLLGASKENYLEHDHPVQKAILAAFSEMVSVPISEILIGIDGCSAPVFAVPLYNAALGFARLANPENLPAPRRSACQKIVAAMLHYPEMVSGFGTFDTCLMQAADGRVLTKAGAEGFQGITVFPTAGQIARGVALKIAEGDISGKFRQNAESAEGRARPVVAIDILRQLQVLSPNQLDQLAPFDARPQYNWRELNVGCYRPAFKLGQ